MSQVIIEPKKIEDAPVVVETPVVVEEPTVDEPTIVDEDPTEESSDELFFTRSVKIDGQIYAKGALVPDDIKEESLQLLIEKKYVLPA